MTVIIGLICILIIGGCNCQEIDAFEAFESEVVLSVASYAGTPLVVDGSGLLSTDEYGFRLSYEPSCNSVTMLQVTSIVGTSSVTVTVTTSVAPEGGAYELCYSFNGTEAVGTGLNMFIVASSSQILTFAGSPIWLGSYALIKDTQVTLTGSGFTPNDKISVIPYINECDPSASAGEPISTYTSSTQVNFIYDSSLFPGGQMILCYNLGGTSGLVEQKQLSITALGSTSTVKSFGGSTGLVEIPYLSLPEADLVVGNGFSSRTYFAFLNPAIEHQDCMITELGGYLCSFDSISTFSSYNISHGVAPLDSIAHGGNWTFFLSLGSAFVFRQNIQLIVSASFDQVTTIEGGSSLEGNLLTHIWGFRTLTGSGFDLSDKYQIVPASTPCDSDLTSGVPIYSVNEDRTEVILEVGYDSIATVGDFELCYNLAGTTGLQKQAEVSISASVVCKTSVFPRWSLVVENNCTIIQGLELTEDSVIKDSLLTNITGSLSINGASQVSFDFLESVGGSVYIEADQLSMPALERVADDVTLVIESSTTDFSSLHTISGTLSLQSRNQISFPVLTSVSFIHSEGGNGELLGSFSFDTLAEVTDVMIYNLCTVLSFPSLELVSGLIHISDFTEYDSSDTVQLDFPLVQSVSNFNFWGGYIHGTISFPSVLVIPTLVAFNLFVAEGLHFASATELTGQILCYSCAFSIFMPALTSVGGNILFNAYVPPSVSLDHIYLSFPSLETASSIAAEFLSLNQDHEPFIHLNFESLESAESIKLEGHKLGNLTFPSLLRIGGELDWNFIDATIETLDPYFPALVEVSTLILEIPSLIYFADSFLRNLYALPSSFSLVADSLCCAEKAFYDDSPFEYSTIPCTPCVQFQNISDLSSFYEGGAVNKFILTGDYPLASMNALYIFPDLLSEDATLSQLVECEVDLHDITCPSPSVPEVYFDQESSSAVVAEVELQLGSSFAKTPYLVEYITFADWANLSSAATSSSETEVVSEYVPSAFPGLIDTDEQYDGTLGIIIGISVSFALVAGLTLILHCCGRYSVLIMLDFVRPDQASKYTLHEDQVEEAEIDTSALIDSNSGKNTDKDAAFAPLSVTNVDTMNNGGEPVPKSFGGKNEKKRVSLAINVDENEFDETSGLLQGKARHLFRERTIFGGIISVLTFCIMVSLLINYAVQVVISNEVSTISVSPDIQLEALIESDFDAEISFTDYLHECTVTNEISSEQSDCDESFVTAVADGFDTAGTFVCSRPSHNQCVIHWSCSKCRQAETDSTISVILSGGEAYATELDWSFQSSSYLEDEPSLVRGSLTAPANSMFKGDDVTVVALVAGSSSYTRFNDDTLTGILMRLSSQIAGTYVDASTYSSVANQGCGFRINVASSEFWTQIEFSHKQTTIDVIAQCCAIITGVLACGRLIAYLVISTRARRHACGCTTQAEEDEIQLEEETKQLEMELRRSVAVRATQQSRKLQRLSIMAKANADLRRSAALPSSNGFQKKHVRNHSQSMVNGRDMNSQPANHGAFGNGTANGAVPPRRPTATLENLQKSITRNAPGQLMNGRRESLSIEPLPPLVEEDAPIAPQPNPVPIRPIVLPPPLPTSSHQNPHQFSPLVPQAIAPTTHVQSSAEFAPNRSSALSHPAANSNMMNPQPLSPIEVPANTRRTRKQRPMLFGKRNKKLPPLPNPFSSPSSSSLSSSSSSSSSPPPSSSQGVNIHIDSSSV